MSLVDGLVALGVVAAFVWIIYVSAAKKNPAIVDKTREFFSNKGNIMDRKKTKDETRQVYDERRTLM